MSEHSEYGCEVCVSEADQGPVIVHQGVYRLYQKPNGDMRVQYKRDDKEEEDFFEVPAALQRLAKMGAEGKLSPMDMMKEVMSLMGSIRG